MEQRKGKVVFVLIDGLADTGLVDYDGQTPLEIAVTPWMDAIARSGLNGLLDPVEPGLACGSDTAHMSILGYDPRKCYRGRGSFEAMGAGMEMNPGDIAFKSNFAHVVEEDNGSTVVKMRRVDRNFHEWGVPLCNYLDGTRLPSFPDVTISVMYATEHRCGVVIRGKQLTDQISGTDPLKDNLPLRTSEPLNDTKAAAHTSDVVNEAAIVIREKLEKHPINVQRRAQNKPTANMVLLRGPGERINVDPFQKVHDLRPFMIAPTCIISGLGKSIGIDVVIAPGATGDYHTDLISKARTAVATLQGDKRYNFAFVHVKAVDDAGHDVDVKKKILYIEKCDEMIGVIVTELQKNHSIGNDADKIAIVVTGDHSTPVLYGDHSFEPVPFAIANVQHTRCTSTSCLPAHDFPHDNTVTLPTPDLLHDSVLTFSENTAGRGHLGRFPGQEVMAIIQQYIRL